MPKAKTLTPAQINYVIEVAHKRAQNPLRDTAALLFSFKAGLRVAEIAGLSWADVCDAMGEVRHDYFEVPAAISKSGRSREVPVHPALYACLVHLKSQGDPKPTDAVICGLDKARVTPKALSMYFKRLYDHCGLYGVSSHSGRRTYITEMARRVGSTTGTSLVDLQRAVGHADLATTQGYIEASEKFAALARTL